MGKILRILIIGSVTFSIFSGLTEDLLNKELLDAASNGFTDRVKLSLDSGANINDATDQDGSSALFLAAAHGHTDTVRLLLDRGANIDQANKYGNNALIFAALNGHTDTVRLLLESGANIDQFGQNGNPVLMFATHNGHTDTVRLLLESGANIDQFGKDGNTALIEAAANGHTDTVRLLLESGANIDHASQYGNTALIFAAFNGHADTVRLLLNMGANIDHANQEWNTALSISSTSGASESPEIRDLLLSAMATSHKEQRFPLMMIMGCEYKENDSMQGIFYNPMQGNFYTGIHNRYAILISEQILRWVFKADNFDAQTITYKYRDWDIYRIQDEHYVGYYLFIPSTKHTQFSTIFKLDSLPKIDIYKTVEYLSRDLYQFSYFMCERLTHKIDILNMIDLLFIKNSTSSLDILLAGHGNMQNSEQYLKLKDLENKIKESPFFGTAISRILYALNIRQLVRLNSNLKFESSGVEELRKFGIIIPETSDLETTLQSILKFIHDLIIYKNEFSISTEENLIANLTTKQFMDILNFFNQNVNVNFLVLESCYSGGINSLLPYLENITLNQTTENKKFKFDIISTTSIEETTYAPAADRAFQIFRNSRNLQQSLSNFQVARTTGAGVGADFQAIPIIRTKNQDKWFPLFRFSKRGQINIIPITKVIVSKYVAENKSLVVNNNANIFVDTKCVNMPIIFKVAPFNKQFVLRENENFFESIKLEKVNRQGSDKLIEPTLQLLTMFAEGKSTDDNKFYKDIFIKHLYIENDEYKNLYMFKQTDNTIVTAFEYGDSKHVSSMERSMPIDQIALSDWFEIKKRADECKFSNINLAPIIKHLTEQKQGAGKEAGPA